MHTRLPQNSLFDEVEEVSWKRIALSETSHGIKRLGEIQSYIELLKLILPSFISLPGIKNSDIAAKTRSLMGLWRVSTWSRRSLVGSVLVYFFGEFLSADFW